jgi:uncharacterized protein (TIGR00369 family)
MDRGATAFPQCTVVLFSVTTRFNTSMWQRLGPPAEVARAPPEAHNPAQAMTGTGRKVMDHKHRIEALALPFAKLLGIEIQSAAPDKVVARMLVRDDLCTRPAVLHGGAIMAFADTLGAAGTVINLAEGTGTTTVESKTNFVGPAPVGGWVIGEATPIHRGRRTQIWQTRISREDGKLVALVIQTQMIL